MSFKDGFYWGGALAANQCEGAYLTDGKGLSMADMLLGGDVNTPRTFCPTIQNDKFYPSHDAIKFFDFYKEDIALFAKMGFNMLRISIAWSRIYPNGDDEVPNEKGLQFYNDVLDECRKHNIEPLVTLCHFEIPWNIAKTYGGFYNREVIDMFVKYATTCFERYKSKVKYWITFNEINLGTAKEGAYNTLALVEQEDLDRIEPCPKDDLKDDPQKRFNALHNVFVASALAVKAGKKINPEFVIGNMVCHITTYPLTCNPKDILAWQAKDAIFLDLCGDVQVKGAYPEFALAFFRKNNIDYSFITEEDKKILKEGVVDMYTFSYYMTNCVTVDSEAETIGGNFIGGAKNPYLKATDWNWQIDPDGLRYTLNRLTSRYPGIPLMVVENGLGAIDKVEEDGSIKDDYRIDYFRQHIQAMSDAVDDGANLLAYTTWGPIDIVSAGTGQMYKRYGFIYVDRHDDGTGNFERREKDSFYWYKKAIESNGKDLD